MSTKDTDSPKDLCICIVNNTSFSEIAKKKNLSYIIINLKPDNQQIETIKQYKYCAIADEKKLDQNTFISCLNFNTHIKENETYYLKTGTGSFIARNYESVLSQVDKEIFNTPFLVSQTKSILPFLDFEQTKISLLKSIAYNSQISYLRCIPIKNLSYNSNELQKTKEFLKETLSIKLHNSFQVPIQYFFSGNFFKDSFSSKDRLKKDLSFRSIMTLIAIAMLMIMLSVVQDYGVSGDEPIGVRHAENVINYLTDDSDAPWDDYSEFNMRYYGFSANVISGIISHISDWDVWLVRHYTNAVLGFIGLLFAGLIGLRIGGGVGGVLSLLLMFLTPRYFGNSMNNLSDVPFATGYIIATYYTIRFFDFWPKVKLRHIAGVIIGIAFTISNRAPGVLLYGYFLFYAGVFYLFSIAGKDFYKIKSFKNDILRFVMYFLIVLVFSYFSSLILWPAGLEEPLTAIYDSIVTFSNFPWSLTTIFNGIQKMSSSLPISYAPTYLLIGMPLFIIIGFIVFLLSIVKNYNPNPIMILLVFGCIFPIAYIIYQKSNIYGGMRHLTFVVTFFILVASKGWLNLIDLMNKKYKLIPISVLAVLMFLPARHMIANHPNQYIYFNEFIGGMEGAYGNYDMDYYYNSIKVASNWLKENEDIENDTITILTNASYVGYFDEYPNVKMTYSRYYEMSKKEWGYAIYANVFIRREQLLSDWFPPQNVVHTIDVDGYPAAFIFKRTSREDIKGFNSLKANKLKEAKQHFKNYLDDFPYNEQVLEGYARVMIRERNFDSTLVYANRALDSNPKQAGALLLKASALNTQKKFKEALEPCIAMIELKEDFADAHFQKGYALKNLNNPNEALKEFQKANAQKENNHQALMQMAEIMVNYKRYDQAFKFYNDILKFRENDIFSMANSAKCQHLLNNNSKAEEILSKIPARNQNHFEVVKTKARIALSKNDMQNANRYVSMARNINNNADMFVIRGLFYLKQNRKDMAKTHLDKAIELDPINREAQELLKSLQSQNKPATSQAQQQKPAQQQSIMFQKPKPKQSGPIKVPTK